MLTALLGPYPSDPLAPPIVLVIISGINDDEPENNSKGGYPGKEWSSASWRRNASHCSESISWAVLLSSSS